MGQRVMILSASVGSGHNAAATVLEQYLERHPDVDQVRKIDVLETTNDLYRTLYDDAYFTLVDSVPWLVGWGYDKGDPPFKLGNSASVWDRLNTTSVVRSIKRYHPDVIICTHFLPTRLVTLLLRRGLIQTKLIVSTTDYDFQGLWLSSPFSEFFVARDETRAHMIDIGVPADRVTVSGVPVNPALGDPVDRGAILRRFRLKPDLPMLLISAGAAGGPHTKAIVQQTMRMTTPFQAVVVCGRNTELKREIDSMVRPHSDRYAVLGYTNEMPDLVRAATLFVGKPGGLSSSECMAAGLPMILIKPIPGQEVRNSDFLLEEGAAARCNYDTTVGYKIDKLLANPDRIRQMSAAARRIGHPHAARQITEAALTADPAHLWISRAAQKSILEASEDGKATIDLEPDRRTQALIDPTTGRSVAVITAAQLRTLSPLRDGIVRTGRRLMISADKLQRFRRRRGDPDLMLTVRNVLGGAPERAVDLQR